MHQFFLSRLKKGVSVAVMAFFFMTFIPFVQASIPVNQPPPATPTLGTPTMDPVSPYNANSNAPVTFTYTLSGFDANTKANMSYNIVDTNGSPKATSFTAPQNPLSNGTYTVTWNGKFDGNVKPADGTYKFQVWGFYGPGNMTALGTKSISFNIDSNPPAFSTPVMDPPSPYKNKMNVNGVKFTTTLSNLFSGDAPAHLIATVHKDSILNPALATFTSDQGVGDFVVTWKDPNAVSGKYFFLVNGSYGNPAQDIEAQDIEFMVDNTITPFIDSLSVSPNLYNYSNNNTISFGYKLNALANSDATINAAIYAKDNDNNPNNDVLVYQWSSLTNQGNGVQNLTWNGKASNNTYVANGDYYFKVWGQEGNFTLDPQQITFTVNASTVSGPSITNLKAVPSTFSPNGDNVNDTTTISFDIDKNANVEISTKIGNNTIILYSASKNAGTVSYTWDGKAGNNVVANGTYTITVKATNADGSNQQSLNVTINNQSGTDCGYPDVKLGMPGITTEICNAFKFTRDRGIFLGDDSTGNVRPFDVINRVESAAVIMRGFNMPSLAASGTNEGFSDVLLNQWYMTSGVVRSAKQYGILMGYPDGTLRPAQQVIRAELLVIFVRASGKIPGDVSVAPFADTPVQPDTMWYVKAVNGAKIWNWIPATTNFYPTAGMTRADVAKLFYAAYQAGNAGL